MDMDNKPENIQETAVNTDAADAAPEADADSAGVRPGSTMDNRPEKMTEQDMLFELQMRTSEEAKKFDIMTVAVFLLILFSLGAMMFILPDKTFSEQENRVLQQTPALSSSFNGSLGDAIKEGKFLDRLIDGKFTEEVSKYYADQFPNRDFFVGLKSMAEIGLLKGGNNNVILGKRNYLVKREDYVNMDMVKTNIDAIEVFADEMANLGVPFNLALVGRPVDALEFFLPSNFPRENSSRIWNELNAYCAASENLGYINLLEPLRNIINNDTGEQIYYKTDHHWTTLGAYYAYLNLLTAFGVPDEAMLSIASLNPSAATDAFFGTTWSSAGMKWIRGDSIQLFRFSGDDSNFVTTIADTKKSLNGFYDSSFLHIKDKYSVFLGGNNPRVDIVNTKEKKRPKLLIIKDSFANSISPILAYNYDLIIIDLRYYKGSVKKIVVEERVDRVLVLNYLDSMTNDNVFGIINYRLGDTYTPNPLPEEPKPETPIKDLYINDNTIDQYTIICPEGEKFTKPAEELKKVILDRTGYELQIVTIADPSAYAGDYDKALVLIDGGLPGKGFLVIKMVGNSIEFRSTMENGVEFAVKQFISKYLKTATGRINFPANYIYSDISDESVMIMPE